MQSGIEGILRSLENLLERFHHSYWFYFMPTGDSFIPIAVFIGPLLLLPGSLIVYVNLILNLGYLSMV